MVRSAIEPYLVTAEQMQQIEGHLFAAGMPVAALMEKVGGLLTRWFVSCFAKQTGCARQGSVCILAGPGHNGGDALVMARELYALGFDVAVYRPLAEGKPLTEAHARYVESLGILVTESLPNFADYDAVIDGLFGFGLSRPISGKLAATVAAINECGTPVYSIDLPSGIHTDTGAQLGSAIRAARTACLGLWKRAFVQESALEYLGACDLIDFDIPLPVIERVLGQTPDVQRITPSMAMGCLPLNRSVTAYKYRAGHLLLIAGSRQYAGAALLSGLGAISSGVGMLTLAVPESIRLALLPQLPAALLVGCEETAEGAIAALPPELNLGKYDAIAFGPGLTPSVPTLLTQLLSAPCPLLLDADGLNLLAQTDVIQTLNNREYSTVLTPHQGEFNRLFGDRLEISVEDALPGEIALQAARLSGAIVLLKGPRSAIASNTRLWFNPESTPALARGGSGDVLTGLMGGLLATTAKSPNYSNRENLAAVVASAVWWHSQAAILSSQQRTVLGVDPLQLAHSLNMALQAVGSVID